jgi:hypothetical protein
MPDRIARAALGQVSERGAQRRVYRTRSGADFLIRLILMYESRVIDC